MTKCFFADRAYQAATVVLASTLYCASAQAGALTGCQLVPNPNLTGSTISVFAPACNNLFFSNFGAIVTYNALVNSAELANYGQLTNLTGQLTNAATLTNHGTLNNESTLLNHGTLTNAATLTNQGTLNNDSTLLNRGTLSNTATLTNQGTLTNDGTLLNHGTLSNTATLTNQGTLTNDGTLLNNGALVNSQAMSNVGTVTNFGTVTNHRTVDNFGALTNYGTLQNFGTLNQRAGSLTGLLGTIENMAAGQLLISSSASVSNSRLINRAGGVLALNVGAALALRQATLSNDAASTLNVGNGAKLDVTQSSTLNTSGLIDLSDFSVLSVDSSSTVESRGTLTLEDFARLSNAGTFTHRGTLTNDGAITNTGAFSVASYGRVIGDGTYMQTRGRTMIEGSLTQAGVTLQGGTLVLERTGTTLTAGTLVQSGQSQTTINADTKLTATAYTLRGGVIEVAPGARLSGGTFMQDGGTLVVDGTMTSSATLNAGVLSGKGTLDALTVNGGAVFAGGDGAVGQLTFAALVAANGFDGGVFGVDILGSAASGLYDVYHVAGVADLFGGAVNSGILDVYAGVNLAPGAYRVLQADGGLNAQFAEINYGGSYDSALYRFSPVYDATGLTLLVAAVPEPSEVGMMLVGLALIGVVGRKRFVAGA